MNMQVPNMMNGFRRRTLEITRPSMAPVRVEVKLEDVRGQICMGERTCGEGGVDELEVRHTCRDSLCGWLI
jgi:hypothetical protein